MRAAIDVPFTDTKAADLAWSITHPLIPPLADRVLSLAGARVELRVLGASHQVLLERGDVRLVETVACLPGLPADLPATATPAVRGVARHDFASSVLHLTPDDFTCAVARIREHLAGRPDALLAVFPGHPLAVTALLALEAGPVVHWCSWHAYPQTGELVRTSSTTVLAPGSEEGR
ncbi:DUF2617 family protein [Nocardiopsis ansamitocini]|uniref:DUF2617 family protein n=1 Tax=Nocardiopsis ansamitocini TaxID=1670832 RepID=A0A9W6P5N0_9ACTN|nr:DUF2617 family protein [Nocardiopsis ansamitocini]GLU47864.1 hypothetical protein Nans01_22150 [Nocardiopsis ansamitocini]